MVDLDDTKPKLYPTLPEVREIPNAPPVVNGGSDDRGHSYRLKIIREIQEFLEKEFKQREDLNKKYLRIARVINTVDNGLITVTIGAEGVGGALFLTGVGFPFATALAFSGGVTGALSLIGNFFCRKITLKAMKHKEIKALAAGNLKLIASHISKALMDDYVSNEEFNLMLEVMEKYKETKEEIRNNTKEKLKTEEKESLIEKGRQEARESFRKLVEKNQGGALGD